MSKNPTDEELFKKLRKEEVSAYHHLVRAVVMVAGPSQSSVYRQILSEARELLYIDSERHTAEMKGATTAPDTLAVVAHRIADGKRTREDRELEDINIDSDTEDDERPPLRTQKVQKSIQQGTMSGTETCVGDNVSSICSTADNEVAFLSLRVTSLKDDISELTTSLKTDPNNKRLLTALQHKKDHLSAVSDRLKIQTQPSQ